MSRIGLVLRSLFHYWRGNLLVGLGTALCTTIILGALLAQDSVTYSLERIVRHRLGETDIAIESIDRFFEADLSERIGRQIGRKTAALLVFDGIASADGGERRVNGVSVIGATRDLWELGPGDPAIDPPGIGEVMINEPLADRLGAAVGEEIVLRIPLASAMPGEAPLSFGPATSTPMRLRVSKLLAPDEFGNYSLRVNQVAPYNAFVAREMLTLAANLGAKANVLLVGGGAGEGSVQAALDEVWSLRDAGVEIVESASRSRLLSDRVFIERAIADAAIATGGQGILTYFVDEIRVDGQSIPYSFVSSLSPSTVGAAPIGAAPASDLTDSEIILNAWAASDLEAGIGDTVTLSYRIPDEHGALVAKSSSFVVSSIVPIHPDDRNLMPRFPGFSDVENCRDWEPGVPLDLELLRDVDEEYWDAHRGSPKAFVSMSAAQNMWKNRFGSLTAVDFREELRSVEAVEAKIRERLSPAILGLSPLPVRDIALRASSEGVSFSELFLGLSAFLIVSALLLIGMLYKFALDRRSAQMGTLIALGFRPSTVRGLLIAEGALIAILGSAAGVPAGIAYGRLILQGLETVWRGAVQVSSLTAHAEAGTLVLGAAAGAAAAVSTMLLGLRRSTRRTAVELRRGSAASMTVAPRTAGSRSGRLSSGFSARGFLVILSIVLGGAALAGVAAGAITEDINPAYYLAAGTGFLIAGIAAFTAILLARRGRSSARPSLAGLAFSNAARRVGRSFAVATMLACGLFIVVTVGLNRRKIDDDWSGRNSGTGGFDTFAELTLPITDELSDEAFKTRWGFGSSLADIALFRVRPGDDASCLNLNRVGSPQIIGVAPASLAGRFSFTRAEADEQIFDPWYLLDEIRTDGAVPAIADQTVITWSLGLSVGDEIEMLDEHGALLRLRLVAGLENSIFQGNLIISERRFLEHFPSGSGYRMFLAGIDEDAAPDSLVAIESVLASAFGNRGIELRRTTDRLAAFYAVENTYLAIFLFLGALGILLGTVGLAVLVARNLDESRGELAVLQAVGFSKRRTVLSAAIEYIIPAAGGLIVGAASAILALAPLIREPIESITLVVILAVGGFIASTVWIFLGASITVREKFLPSLRQE